MFAAGRRYRVLPSLGGLVAGDFYAVVRSVSSADCVYFRANWLPCTRIQKHVAWRSGPSLPAFPVDTARSTGGAGENMRLRPLADDAGKWGRRGGVQALWHAAGDVGFAAGGGGFAHGFGH